MAKSDNRAGLKELLPYRGQQELLLDSRQGAIVFGLWFSECKIGGRLSSNLENLTEGLN